MKRIKKLGTMWETKHKKNRTYKKSNQREASCKQRLEQNPSKYGF